MDEVLASLQRGQIQLRKVTPPSTAPPAADMRSNLMSAIRQGVTLKKVSFSTKENRTFADTLFTVSIEKETESIKKSDICVIQLS